MKDKEDRGDGKLCTPPEKPPYENSYQDMIADNVAAKRRGRTTAEYEDSAADRVADAAGQRRLDAEHTPPPAPPTYKPGTPASKNPPKAAHGYGHSASARDGNLRNSGHAGAHRIGKKK